MKTETAETIEQPKRRGRPRKTQPVETKPEPAEQISDVPAAVESNEPAFLLPYVTPVGLDFPKDGTFEQWELYAKTLKITDRGLSWWIGDLVNAALDRGGDFEHKAFQLIGQLGYKEQSIMNMRSVARQIPAAERRDDLDWAHQKAAAYLPKKKRQELLELAVQQDMSVRQVEEAVREYNAKHAQKMKPAESATNGLANGHAGPELAHSTAHSLEDDVKIAAAQGTEVAAPEGEKEEPAEDVRPAELRKPDQVAKEGASFPVTEETFQEELLPLARRAQDSMNALIGMLEQPKRTEIAEINEKCATVRDHLAEITDLLETWGAEPL